MREVSNRTAAPRAVKRRETDPMPNFAQHQNRPSLRLLVLHDDADRELAYTSGAEKALAEADKRRWTVVSMKNDFKTVFDSADR